MKKARLSYYESQLLYFLVDDFEKSYHKEIAKYPFYDIRRFPRKKYHMVLINHPVCRCRTFPSLKTPGLIQPSNVASVSFCVLIKRLERNGWIRRVKDGKKLNLKITKNGLLKIKCHYEYYKLGIIS